MSETSADRAVYLDSEPHEKTRCLTCGGVVEPCVFECGVCAKLEYLAVGQSVEVQFPDGWQAGWTIDALVADSHTDPEGRTFKHRYNVRHADGRELREIHPLCARVVSEGGVVESRPESTADTAARVSAPPSPEFSSEHGRTP